jgi:ribosomal protein S18 acetylase RimI-like enzyme
MPSPVHSVMRVRSLGLHTDLALHDWRGRVLDRNDHLVVLHPDNPGFRNGNLLVFERPPAEDDAQRWCDLFDREVGAPPRMLHRSFTWDGLDGEEGELTAFLARGFTVERHEVMAARRLHPAPPPPGVTLRLIEGERAWSAVVAAQRAAFVRQGEEEERFIERLFAAYGRALVAGHGVWWGAFVGDDLAANLGIFRVGELARYQAVMTDAAYRRRGIASALVAVAAEEASRAWQSELVLLEVEPGGAAVGLYHRLGFATIERRVALVQYPRDDPRPGS